VGKGDGVNESVLVQSSLRFKKYHALGNDYLVFEPDGFVLTAENIRHVCNRRLGVGSDGILLGPLRSDRARFRLRIFNPDGSEAEKSGNGLRIFCRHLWDAGLVKNEPFTVETAGGVVTAQVLESGESVMVGMGAASFLSSAIPVMGPIREVIMETIDIADSVFEFCAVTMGNPHCVVPLSEIDASLARKYGPLIEVNSMFPNRTNVQFLKILDRNNIRIEIWERGAGYTLASGSSSCAAAAVARRLGRCEPGISVHMPGGVIRIDLDDDFNVTMKGPVAYSFRGSLSL
jgi:diaminopimelate epimerase